MNVEGVKLLQMPLIIEEKGTLTFGEINTHLAFIPQRYFLIYDVPPGKTRGQHAHRTTQEILICVKGSCSILLDDGQNREEILLNSPIQGLYIPQMIWSSHNYNSNAILLALASEIYQPDGYIHNYEKFVELRRKNCN